MSAQRRQVDGGDVPGLDASVIGAGNEVLPSGWTRGKGYSPDAEILRSLPSEVVQSFMNSSTNMATNDPSGENARLKIGRFRP
jgi:hypothetical protein